MDGDDVHGTVKLVSQNFRLMDGIIFCINFMIIVGLGGHSLLCLITIHDNFTMGVIGSGYTCRGECFLGVVGGFTVKYSSVGRGMQLLVGVSSPLLDI